MRRHAKASSAGSNPRKPSGQGSSPPSGRFRLAVLVATMAAFLLVPAAQAFATDTATVNIAGTGSGEVSSVGGADLTGEGFGKNEFEGEPPIKCSYASPGPKSGTCSSTMGSKGGSGEEFYFSCCEIKGIALNAIPTPGSELTGWTIEEGAGAANCGEPEEGVCLAFNVGGGDVKVTATFEKEIGFLLTVKKIGTGEGTVVSSPAAIECGKTCAKSFEGKVTLTASPAAGSVFTSWSKCVKTVEGTGPKGHTCTVNVTAAMTVEAKFTKVQAITGAKDSEGNGFGTVTSAPGGISCGPACSSATAVFTEGSTVTVKAAPVASTSVFAGWTSCPGTPEGASCKVVASEAKSATAKFTLIPQFALTLTKSGGGTGTVSSSPAGISCGPTCSSAVGSYNKGKEVTLKEVPATGSTFGGWSGACSGTGECKVTMSEAKSVGAEFK